MANYKLQYSGAQIDTAIGKALNTNLNNYPTKTEVENKGYLTADQVNALIDEKLSNADLGGGGGSSGTNLIQMLIDNRGIYSAGAIVFDNGTSCSRFFANTTLDDSAVATIMAGVDTSSVSDMSYMFNYNEGLDVFDPTFSTSFVNNMSNMFAYCTTVTEVILDCSSVNNVQNMFNGCTNLYRAELQNIGGDIMSNTTNWFKNCAGLGVLDFRTAVSVPNLTSTTAFSGAATGFDIIVPDNLYEEWSLATNWSSVEANWIRASEYTE